ncbi:MAG: polysaccharide biosynthesis C-terminal domain-containing protein [Bacteroidales bacterium]|nr:polysaccharide biosynthesis C-terminal domain-containing protein [Bacteroidales bacterium]
MFKKILNTFGTKIAAAAIHFLIAVVISQAIGDVGKGTQTLLLTTVSFILIFSDIVCGESVVFLTPRYRFRQLLPPSAVWAALVAVGMGCVLRWCYPAGLEPGLLWHVAALSFIASLGAIHTRYLIGKEEIGKANYNTLLQPVLLIATLLVYYVGLRRTDIGGYVLGLYVSYGGSLLLGVWMLRGEYFCVERVPSDYRVVLKDLFKYGFLNQTGHFVQFFNLRLSYYLLDHYLDKGRVGVFSNAVSLAEAVWIISNSIALVQYARIANAGDTAYAQRLTLSLSKFCLSLSAVAVLLLALLPPSVYAFLFGPSFGEVSGLIRILAPGVWVYCLFLILGHYYSGIGRYQMNTFASLCGLAATCLFGFTLIPRMGAAGAALTSTLSYAVNAVFLLCFFLRESRFRGRDFLPGKAEWTMCVSEYKQVFKKLR